MPNEHILKRLKGIQGMLIGAYNAGEKMSSATKGYEREQFINLFLSQVFPPTFRFGSGDVTDKEGNRSGQLDVVIEFPFLPSLPIIGVNSSRLYLAEGIAAVLEIKSDIKKKWHKVKEKANNLSIIKRDVTGFLNGINPPGERIPFFAIGYEGWSDIKTLERRLNNNMDGILVIGQPGLFCGKIKGDNQIVKEEGPMSLWGLLYCIHSSISSLFVASTDVFGLKS